MAVQWEGHSAAGRLAAFNDTKAASRLLFAVPLAYRHLTVRFALTAFRDNPCEAVGRSISRKRSSMAAAGVPLLVQGSLAEEVISISTAPPSSILTLRCRMFPERLTPSGTSHALLGRLEAMAMSTRISLSSSERRSLRRLAWS